MTTVGYATLDVIPSMKGLRAQLDHQSSPAMAAAGKRGGELFGDAAGRSAGGRFKSKFGALAKDAFAPVAGLVAGAAVVDFFKDAISGASDLAESANKVQVIFGDATAQVQDFASQGAKALGQTRLDVLNAAASFGTFGKAAGLSGGNLADFSTKLAGLSTDMASFFNTSPEQAVEAIGAALRGEAEPIRAFGVLLDDATLRQEALRQGLIKTTKQALTPQQKVLAAYQVILQQTASAQGDFARTSDGLANQQRILAAQWSEMKTEVGSKLLPAVTQFVTALNNGVIPAVSAAGGAVGEAVSAFNELPEPVKAATAAWVAFRLASTIGVGSAVTRGLTSASSAMDSLRLRTMLAADAFKASRATSLEWTGSSIRVAEASSRMSASLNGLRAGAAGAGAALQRGLSGAVGILGGPWGIALAAGTVALTHFWQEHQKAKAEVDQFVASLDQETGAFTKQSRELVAKRLLDAGVLDDAKALGLQLNLVTDAALGQGDALQRLTGQLDAMAQAGTSTTGQGQFFTETARSAMELHDALLDSNGVVVKSQHEFSLLSEASRDVAAAASSGASATGRASASLDTYAQRVADARGELQKLLAVENKRRLSLVQDRRDRIALLDTIAAAREEARKGKRTLNENTQAGRDNLKALLDIADQWNQSTPKVQQARGAYGEMRRSFIDVAEEMGKTRDQAQKLADRILAVPKTASIKFQSEDYQKTLAEVERLQQVREIAIKVRFQRVQEQVGKTPTFASGGKVGGSGTGDTQLILADPREWVINPDASAYYGDEFMRRLNAKMIPKAQAQRAVSSELAPAGSGSAAGGQRVDVHLHVTGDSGQQVQLVRAVINDDAALTRNNVRMHRGRERG